MSLSIEPLELYKVREPVIRTKEKKIFGVFVGGQDNIYYNYQANSSSNSNVVWNINVPSENIFIDRKVYVRASVTITLNGDDLGTPLFQPGYDALRAFPLTNSMSTLTVQINNGAITSNINDYIQALMKYSNYDELYYEFSNSPQYQDQTQTYEELEGTIRNPLSHYGDGHDGGIAQRGSFPCTIVSNTNTQAVLKFDICEPLMLSPMHFNRSKANGFIGVKQFSTQIVWDSDLFGTMFSHSDALRPLLSGSVVFDDAPDLLIRTITPSELVSLDIPQLTIYPYHDIQRQFTDLPLILSGETTSMTSQVLSLDVVPRRFFIFIQRSRATKGFNKCDAYLTINSVSINFANRSGLLSSASQRDLYNISKKNGVNLTWKQWTSANSPGPIGNYTGVGSVLCLYVPEDLAISNSDMLAPGIQERLQFQIKVNYTNTNPIDDIIPQLVVVYDLEGVFTITKGLGLAQNYIMTKQDVINAKESPEVMYEDVNDVYGGDFFADIGTFLKSIPGGISKVGKFVKDDILPVVKTILEVLPMFGLGLGTKGGKLLTKESTGGFMVGGKMMSRDELRQKIKKYMK